MTASGAVPTPIVVRNLVGNFRGTEDAAGAMGITWMTRDENHYREPTRISHLDRPRTPTKVDPRCVVNADQARRFLAAVGELGPRGARMVAFFGCMYYAALRPEEATDLQRAWAGHTVDVLLRVYAKCIAGQQEEAKRRIFEATQPERDDRKPGSDNQDQDQGQDERPN